MLNDLWLQIYYTPLLEKHSLSILPYLALLSKRGNRTEYVDTGIYTFYKKNGLYKNIDYSANQRWLLSPA